MSSTSQHIDGVKIDDNLEHDKKAWVGRKPGKAEIRIYEALLANEWSHQYKVVNDFAVNPASADKWLKRLRNHKFLESRQMVRERRERTEYTLTVLGRDFVKRRLGQNGLEKELASSQTVRDTSTGQLAASPKFVEVVASRLLKLCSKLAVGNSEAQMLVRSVGSLTSESQKLQEVTALVEELHSKSTSRASPKANLEFVGNHFKLSSLTALGDHRFVTAGYDRAIRVWKSDTLDIPLTIQVQDSTLALAALPQRADSFLSVDIHAVLFWDLAAAKPKVLTRMQSGVSSAVHVLANNRVALADSSSTVRVIDMKTGNMLAQLDGHSKYVHSLASLTENLLVSASSEQLIVRDLENKKRLLIVEDSITCATAISSEIIAYATDDYKIRFLNIVGDKVWPILEGHQGRIEHLLPLGTGRLASAGADRTVKVWDINSGACIFSEATTSIRQLCKTSDGLIFADKSGDIFKLLENLFTNK